MTAQKKRDEPLLRLLDAIGRESPKNAIRRMRNIRRILKLQIRRLKKKAGGQSFPDLLESIRREVTPADTHLFPKTWGQVSEKPFHFTMPPPTPPGVIREVTLDPGQRNPWDVPAAVHEEIGDRNVGMTVTNAFDHLEQHDAIT